MRHLNEYFPFILTTLVTVSTIIYTFYSILLWRTARAAAEISRHAALSNLWAELNRFVEIHRARNAAETGFLEGLSSLILEYMVSNLLTRTQAAKDKTFDETRIRIAALIENHTDDAKKFPWVMRLVDPEL
ncbi:MAG: hypothetical protein JO076_12215 [Verrucomicrobia bacterium]|nr:hypothetical protein [Verrucomicrobiota bacterium]